jgi:hypothetical protein
MYNRVMVKSNPVKQRRRGPRPTGINPIMAFRPLPPLRASIEAYAKANDVSVSDAMRRLIEAGLKRPPRVKAKD